MAPLYWKQLAGIAALELIAYRHVWSLAFVLALMAVQGGLGAVRAALGSAGAIASNFLSAALLTSTWLVYVWAVNHDHVVDCSLGYFLVPLVTVAAGRFVLKETLRRAQWIAIALAAAGVVALIAQLGRLPWIALALAGSWSGYSLLRKRSPLGSLAGLTVETLLLLPFAIGFFVWQSHTGGGTPGPFDFQVHLLLACSGGVTAIPLLLFAYGTRRIRMTTLGLLQYVGPTASLILGIWVYHEPFTRAHVFGFVFIWAGLALYTADNLATQRRWQAR